MMTLVPPASAVHAVQLGRAPRDGGAELHLAGDADAGVALADLDALRQQARDELERPAHHVGRRPLVRAAVRVGDDGAVDLGQHVLRDQVARDRAGADRHLGQDLGRHDGVHADVAEDDDVVRVVALGEVVRQHEDADLAEHGPVGEQRDHRPEELPRAVRGAADHHVGVAEVHRVDAEQPRFGERLARRPRASAPRSGTAGWVRQSAANSSTRSAAPGDVDERALAQRVRDARRVEVAQARAPPRRAPSSSPREEDRLDVARQVADRLEDPGVESAR